MSRIWKELGLILTFSEKERLMKNFILFQYFKGWLKRDGCTLLTRSHMEKTRCSWVQVALGEISSQWKKQFFFFFTVRTIKHCQLCQECGRVPFTGFSRPERTGCWIISSRLPFPSEVGPDSRSLPAWVILRVFSFSAYTIVSAGKEWHI